MPRQQLNVRIPALTRRELDWLTREYGMSEGEVVILAVDLLYHRNENVAPIDKRDGHTLLGLLKGQVEREESKS